MSDSSINDRDQQEERDIRAAKAKAAKYKYIPYTNDFEFFRANDSSGIGNSPNENQPRLPMVPWVHIQFRTAIITGGKTEDEFLASANSNETQFSMSENSEWTTVSARVKNINAGSIEDLYEELNSNLTESSMKFDNYFDNVELEDNGGFLKCSLSLFDKDSSRLESIIVRSILAMKVANKKADEATEAQVAALQFKTGGPQSINFRIRFGYADAKTGTDSDLFIDSPEITDKEFMERATKSSNDEYNKMVTKSPWYYFQMMGCKFTMSSAGGLSAAVEGISMGNSVFDRMKIYQHFCIMKGTPNTLLSSIGKELFWASKGRIQFIGVDGKICQYSTTDDKNAGKGTNRQYENTSKYTKDFDAMQSKLGKDMITSDSGITWEIEPMVTTLAKYTNQNSKDFAKASEENMYRVEIQYGSEPRRPIDKNGKVETNAPYVMEFMTVRSLLDQICAKVPPIYSFETNGSDGTVLFKDPNDVKSIFTSEKDTVEITKGSSSGKNTGTFEKNKFRPIPYSYSVEQITLDGADGKGPLGKGTEQIVRVRFFYKDQGIQKQDFVRKYVWRNNPQSVMTQFAVSSELDFAQMNQTIAFNGNGTSNFFISKGETKSKDEVAGGPSTSIPGNDFSKGFKLVSNLYDDVYDDPVERLTVAQQVINNMNSQSFKGTVQLLGDPFYLFGGTMQPYQYGIYVEVLRDRDLYSQSLDAPLEKSYMSGFYLISNIKHSLSSSGFSTILTVMKWPTQTIKLQPRK